MSGINAGDIVFYLTGENAQLKQALDEAGVSFEGLSKAALGLGAAITGALAGTLYAWSEAGGAIQDFSARTGLAAESVSGLKFALEQGGSGLEDMERALLVMSKGVDEAKTAMAAGDAGASAYAASLARIGLSVNDLIGLTPDQQMIKIGVATAALSDPAERAAVGVDLLGKGFTRLLPTFAEGEAGIAALTARAAELGIVFSAEEAARAEAFGDTMDELKASFMGLVIEIGPLVASLVENVVPAITNTIASIRSWIDQHPELSANIVTATAIIGGLAIGLGTLGLAIPPIITGVTLLSTAFTAITGVGWASAAALGGVEAAAIGASGIAAGGGIAAVLTAIAGPVGLIVVVAAAITSLGMFFQALGDAKVANEDAAKSIEGANKSQERMIETLRKQGVQIDDASIKGKSHNEVMEILKVALTEAEQAQQREISALNGVTESFLVANTAMTDGVGILALLEQNSESHQTAVQNQTAAVWGLVDALSALSNTQASMPNIPQGMNGMSQGLPPGMPFGNGGLMGRSGLGGQAPVGSGGNGVTINISLNSSIPMDSEDRAVELSEVLGREMHRKLRAVGAI